MYVIIKSEDKSIHLIDGKTENFSEYLKKKTWYEITLKDYEFCEYGILKRKNMVSFYVGLDSDDGFSNLFVKFEDLDFTYEYINRMRRSFIKTNGYLLNTIYNLRKSVYMKNIDSPPISKHEEIISSVLDLINSYNYLFPYDEITTYDEPYTNN